MCDEMNDSNAIKEAENSLEEFATKEMDKTIQYIQDYDKFREFCIHTFKESCSKVDYKIDDEFIVVMVNSVLKGFIKFLTSPWARTNGLMYAIVKIKEYDYTEESGEKIIFEDRNGRIFYESKNS